MKKYILLVTIIFLCSSPYKSYGDEHKLVNISNLTKKTENGITIFMDEKHIPFTGTAYYLWENGKQKIRANFKHGKFNGVSETFDIDGKIETKVNYKDNKKDGLAIYYYKNERIKEEQPWKDDKVDGLVKKYDENGILETELSYKNGKKEGLSKTYYKNGRVKAELSLTDGKKNGLFKSYYENGQTKSEIIYKNDIENGISKNYYENGQLKIEEHIKNGKREGIMKTYYEDGKLKTEKSFKDGVPDGPFKSYYENGQLEVEGNIKNGNVDGLQKKYYENGILGGEINYKNGKQDGLSRMYYKNGSLLGESIWENSKQIKLSTYNINGQTQSPSIKYGTPYGAAGYFYGTEKFLNEIEKRCSNHGYIPFVYISKFKAKYQIPFLNLKAVFNDVMPHNYISELDKPLNNSKMFKQAWDQGFGLMKELLDIETEKEYCQSLDQMADDIIEEKYNGDIQNYPEWFKIGIKNEFPFTMDKYLTKNHQKSPNLDMSIKYPSSWIKKEGERPHVVQVFKEQYPTYEKAYRVCMIVATSFKNYGLSKNDFQNEIKGWNTKDIEDFLGEHSKVIDYKYTKYDRNDGISIKSKATAERAGQSFLSYYKTALIACDNYLVQVGCLVGGKPEDEVEIEKAFNKSLPLFTSIENSIIFMDQYKNNKY